MKTLYRHSLVIAAAGLALLASCGRVGYQDGASGHDAGVPGDAAIHDAPAVDASALDASVLIVGDEVQVSTSVAHSNDPVLVWTGSEYGIAWAENAGIMFVRVDQTGARLGQGIQVSSGDGTSAAPTMVWTGTEYGIAWHDDRDGNFEIYFVRVDGDGQVIGGDVRITENPAMSTDATLAYTGAEFAVAWQDELLPEQDIYMARIDSQGTRIGANIRVTSPPSSGARQASLVWTGNELALAWHDFRIGSEIYFARFDATGTRLGDDVQVTDSMVPSRFPSLVWTGMELAVAYQDDRAGPREIFVSTIDEAGTVLGPGTQVSYDPRTSAGPRVAAGRDLGVVWSEGEAGARELYFALVDGTGEIRATVQLAGAPQASDGALAWNGEHFAVVWEDGRDTTDQIYFRTIIPTL